MQSFHVEAWRELLYIVTDMPNREVPCLLGESKFFLAPAQNYHGGNYFTLLMTEVQFGVKNQKVSMVKSTILL